MRIFCYIILWCPMKAAYYQTDEQLGLCDGILWRAKFSESRKQEYWFHLLYIQLVKKWCSSGIFSKCTGLITGSLTKWLSLGFLAILVKRYQDHTSATRITTNIEHVTPSDHLTSGGNRELSGAIPSKSISNSSQFIVLVCIAWL